MSSSRYERRPANVDAVQGKPGASLQSTSDRAAARLQADELRHLTGRSTGDRQTDPVGVLQAKELRSISQAGDVRRQAALGLEGPGTQMPHLNAIQGAFGQHNLSGIRAHLGGPAVQATSAMGALAYASGDQIAFGAAPDLHTAAHEAAHVVQQRAGVRLSDGVGREGDVYERQADAVADRVVQGRSAVDLLPEQQLGAASDALQHKKEKLEKKKVSSKAAARLGPAKKAIKHTKDVFNFGAGNQAEAIVATRFNSYYRLEAMREDTYWTLTPEAQPVADANAEALTAAKADMVHGGNCGEHAEVAFDYLRVNTPGETISVADKEGLDHAFVLMGSLSEADHEIVVSDPWPTAATATLWEDHFAYTPDRDKTNIQSQMVADGQNVKAVIAAGLTLSAEGKLAAEKSDSVEQTRTDLKDGLGDWIWEHADAAGKDKKYQYKGPSKFAKLWKGVKDLLGLE